MAHLPICMTVVGQSTVHEGRASFPDGETVEIELRPVAVRYEIRHSPACEVHRG